MPDQPEPKRTIRLPSRPADCAAEEASRGAVRPAYAELHCKTNFSFLEGASHPDELVARAVELGYTALAITDRASLAGVVRAHGAAKQVGLKLLIGAEITPVGMPAVVLWATDRASYGRLARLITRGRREAPKGECRLTFDDLAAHAAGLLAGVLLEPSFFSVAGLCEAGSSAVGVFDSDDRAARAGDASPRSTARFALLDKPAVAPGGSAPGTSSPVAGLCEAGSSAVGVFDSDDRAARAGDASPRSTARFALLDKPAVAPGASQDPSPGLRPPSPRFAGRGEGTDVPGSERIERAEQALRRYRDLFGDRCYLLAELHYGLDDERHLAKLIELARRTRVPLVAAGGACFHHPDRQPLCDVLTAVRAGKTVAESAALLFPNAERYLKSPEQMRELFARAPDCLRRTIEVADRCTFSLDELRYEYPEELVPPGLTPLEHLTRLAWEGACARYQAGIPEKVRKLLDHELAIIAELRYEAYFLTVWDLVRFARGRGILCQGRGSAANSAVCYCLGVTAVDPERLDVLFERFISRERNEAPDIDVDFEHERREEVIQYLYRKYGRDRVGMTAEVITYRPRSAVRDVGKALGLSLDRVDALAKQLDAYHAIKLPERCRQAGVDPDSDVGRRLLALVEQLLGFPRHLGQHVGGMVMTQGPLCELVPIENAAMPDRTVIEWDKDDLDELGILKVDCLSLGMLTAIRKSFQLIQRHHGRHLTLADVPEGDPAVYAMISRADTMGVFQIESRAQMSMLPRLRPNCFYDLVVEVAIVRPGPIQGNMVHPYLRRRAGIEPVSYPNDEIRAVLHKTLGVPLFQEQAMRLAVVAAGFTPGEADQLRRAMGAWRRPGVIEQFKQKLTEGMLAKGLSPEFAQHVFNQIRGFGEYGFPESHAASFALLAYVSAWLKCHYPAAFCAALLNSQPMGFYAPAQLVRNAREHGVEILPVDVNYSGWDATLEAVLVQGQRRWGVRLGLRQISGLGQTAARRIVAARAGDASPRSTARFALLDKPAVAPGGSAPGTSSPVAGLCEAGSSAVGVFDSDDRAARAGDASPRSTARFALLDKPAVAPDGSQDPSPGLRPPSPRFAGRGEGTDVPGSENTFYRTLEDFARRTGLSQATIARLAAADAFGSLELDRRQSLWQALAQEKRAPDRPLLAGLVDDEPPAPLPAMTAREEVFADYRMVGLSLKAHPLSFYRVELDKLRVVPAARLAGIDNGRFVRVAGLVLVRQRPSTAKGITFVTLEDETGTTNLIVKMDVWERFHHAARTAAAMLAAGRLQKQKEVIHVLVSRLEDLAGALGAMRSQSRDFH